MRSTFPMDKTIEQFYTAIKTNNIDLLKTLITADVTLYWQGPSEIPWAGTWQGIEKVLEFFDILSKSVTAVSVELLTKLSDGETQIVF